MSRYLQITTATDSLQAARNIAAALVRARLAACVQVIGPIRSTYRWKGGIEQATEHLCLAKTTDTLYKRVEAEIRRLHPYECPEIVATPICRGSRDYLRWLREATAPSPCARARRSRRT